MCGSARASLTGEELDAATRETRAALLGLGLTPDQVRLADHADVPTGARAGDALAIGQLVVSLVNSAGLLAAVVSTVQARLGGASPRSARLEIDGDAIEVTGISSAQQQELIAQWAADRGKRS